MGFKSINKENEFSELWSKKLLIPLWVLQMLSYSAVLITSAVYFKKSFPYGGPLSDVLIWLMVFSVIAITFCLVETILLCCTALHPGVVLLFDTLSTILWLISMVRLIFLGSTWSALLEDLNIDVVGSLPWILLGLTTAAFLISAAKLAVSAVATHRLTKGRRAARLEALKSRPA